MKKWINDDGVYRTASATKHIPIVWGIVKVVLEYPFFFLFFLLLLNKSRFLFKFVSVLLSALVKRVGVSRMWDFFLNNIQYWTKIIYMSKNSLIKPNFGLVFKNFCQHSPPPSLTADIIFEVPLRRESLS